MPPLLSARRRARSTFPLLSAALALAACASRGADPAQAGAAAGGDAWIDVADGVVLVLHGGAGTIARESLSAEDEALYRRDLESALREGLAVIEAGRPPVDAVVAAIRLLEDSPRFNAGKGAVLTNAGRCELDASLMVGAGPTAGAVAAITNARHPIDAARAVMDHTEHVMLAGPGADEFARTQGLELVPNEWFHTERRLRELEKAKRGDDARAEAGEVHGAPREASGAAPRPSLDGASSYHPSYLGTVGCIARDHGGRLAAGTSTGGMTNKRFGRVGDSPVLGAGTWADDRTCGVSCTGHGEFFLRGAVAHDVHARMLHGGEGLGAASAGALAELTARGGSGGFVALAPDGTAAAAFNSKGMYRGWIDRAGRVTIRIWRTE